MANQYKGYDVSVYQAPSSTYYKNAGAKFMIIRAGFSQTADRNVDGHVKCCTEAGIPYGFYWYSYAYSVEDAIREAKACISVISKYKPSFPVFFDMEEKSQIDQLTNQVRTDMAIAFCEEIKKSGFKPGIYANPSWMETYYYKNQLVGKYDIWLAHWTGSPDYPSRYNYGQKLWQYGLEQVNGIGQVDVNICFTDEYFPKTPTPTPQPTPTPTPAPTNVFKKGDEVKLNNTPLYGSSTASYKSTTLSGTFYIHDDEVLNNRMRITTPKGNTVVTGWVSLSDITKTTTPTAPKPVTPVTPTKPVTPAAPAKAKFKAGDLVKITGTKYYSGVTIPAWVREKVWIVYSVTGDKVIINKSTDGKNAIMSPVKDTDLALYTPNNTTSEIKTGDLVKIIGSKYYSGSTVPGWVKAKNWYVSYAATGNDRVVVNKSEDGKNAINSPFKRSDLKKIK